MTEFLQNLNFQDLWIALIAFLSVNGMTILGLIVAWAKGKITHGMKLEEIKVSAQTERQYLIDSCNQTLNKVTESIKDLEVRLNEAIKAAKEAEVREIEAQSIKLTETLNEAKAKAVNLTEELDKL